MSVDVKTREALNLKNLRLPTGIPVLAIEVADEVDWTGDEALRVTVVIDEDVSDATLMGPDSLRMKRAIRESLLANGITLFPYIFVTKPSERLVANEED